MAATGAQASSPQFAPVRARATGGMTARFHLVCLRVLAILSRLARGRGMQKCTWILARRVFGNSHSAVLELPSGGRLKIRLADGYWTRLLIPGYVYESDIGSVLARACAEPGIFFLDCGANIGYWSVVCSRALPAGRVLAVEASPPNYAQLVENAALNDGRFTAAFNALWERDGEEATIVSHELRHAGSSIVDRRDKMGRSGYAEHKVPTATIDSLCASYIADPAAKIVVKLDVEGAEIPALKGGRRAFAQRQTLLLYEEHGQDPECRVSNFVMTELGFEVLHCDSGSRVTRMHSLEDIRRLKVDVHGGYNFIAFPPGSSFAALFEPAARRDSICA